ncbi:Mitochondrial glycoprotein [Trema orientale]|uniref:Mitochondrial glycoprotein n=1 Tax=Trema orientale TaxID=63057 RepID=A0A2P5E620_TREOI|nr:Mitochondrial glycoprotein [Trema orientale]
MARLIRPLRKTLPFLSSSSSSSSKNLGLKLHHQPHHISLLNPNLSLQSPRTYISEMRKSAFDGNLLRLLRNEIQYELENSPLNQPVTKFDSFTVDERPGEQWVSLKRKFEDEDIKVEATMFDGAVCSSITAGSPAPVAGRDDVELHISLIVNISKEKNGNMLEIVCSAWTEELEIDKVSIRKQESVLAKPYPGPIFKDLDDELQNSLYEFLEARGINDELAVFLHHYMKNKDRTEFIRWMETVKSFVEKK